MKNKWLVFVGALCLASCAFAQSNFTAHALRPYTGQQGQHGNPPSLYGCNSNPCEVTYYGGGVFETTPAIYIVYYGNWTTTDRSVIDSFFTNLSGTTMAKINTRYSDNSGKFVPGTVSYNSSTNSYHDNYSKGKNVNDGVLQQIIANAIKGGHLPNDKNGIYFALTYKDVFDSDGFCSNFCGYHSPSTSIVSGEIIRYSFVGDPDQCASGCEASAVLGDPGSPNNAPGADGTINIMWHEFSETASDPNVGISTAWNGGPCGESGDCCAWLFGATKLDGNGNHYNETFGGHNYITQLMLELKSKKRGTVLGACENVWKKNPK